MTDAERELLTKSAQGDIGAFGEIVRRYQCLVYAVAIGIAREPSAAKDIAQETFLSAFAALRDLRSPEAFSWWLRKITRNKALAWKREQGRLVSLDEAAIPKSQHGAPEVERAYEEREADAFRAEIRKVILTLSESLRVPVLLCYVNGISTAEAARCLGIKAGTLRKRLHDGKRKLQERLVKMAEKALMEHRLPPDFASRCICGCRRAAGTRPVKRRCEGR